jgi:hypothetical protein
MDNFVGGQVTSGEGNRRQGAGGFFTAEARRTRSLFGFSGWGLDARMQEAGGRTFFTAKCLGFLGGLAVKQEKMRA